MSSHKKAIYGPVKADPVKSFFVSMLTRDITLEEAILDLLDNCVDGILRSRSKQRMRKQKRPYSSYRADIEFGRDSFTISDNCGGIPWDLHDYAFRMGRDRDRPPDPRGTVGVYGIGMKRAIFKLGTHCLISTSNKSDQYELEITPQWLQDDDRWDLNAKPGQKSTEEDGTTIYVSGLHTGIKDRFASESFHPDLERMVATHYSFIIDKGLEVRINTVLVKPRTTRFIFAEVRGKRDRQLVRPFIFRSKSNGVEIFLTVGFTRPIPSQDDVLSEQEEKKYSSEEAGWTVVCNDRAVLYCDRSEVTGWGEANVPRYHTQFIAISGIVEFTSEDPKRLPTTTTKRGVDGSDPLYLQVKNKMREGMRLFTNYTNKWKDKADEARKQMRASPTLSFDEIKAKADELEMRATTRTVPAGEQFSPELPMPKKLESHKRRISFAKDIVDIRRVSDFVFEDREHDPSEVGEKCFDLILREATK